MILHMLFRFFCCCALFFLSRLESFEFAHRMEERQDSSSLYPKAAPYQEGMLQVSELHAIHYAVYGNPEGVPVVLLHGGPGGGCADYLTRFFDLKCWKVVMFDQRGGMSSEPLGELRENTPHHSVSDMEKLRTHLGIDQWVLFGGSWGSSLALLYGETFPDRCKGFMLRGLFLARPSDVAHILYGMQVHYPEAHARFASFIPEEERQDLFHAYYHRVMDPRPEVHLPAAKSFMLYDGTCATLRPDPGGVQSLLNNEELTLNLARTFLYYAGEQFFLSPDQLLQGIGRVSSIPCLMIQGRFDAICPPAGAFTLYQQWNNSQLWIVSLGGHSALEPAFGSSLVEATDLFAKRLIAEEKLNLSPTGSFTKRFNNWFRSNR